MTAVLSAQIIHHKSKNRPWLEPTGFVMNNHEGNTPQYFEDFFLKYGPSQSQNLALTVSHVLTWLDSGSTWHVEGGQAPKFEDIVLDRSSRQQHMKGTTEIILMTSS